MAFANFTGSGHKTPNNPNNNNNNNNNQNPGQFQNPYFGGGQPTGDDVKEKLINYKTNSLSRWSYSTNINRYKP